MSSSKEVYNQRLNRLQSAQEKLIHLAEQLEARSESFRQLTEGYAERIKKNGQRRVAWYMKRWLRCFIGIKDEVMVLISGEIIRKYHESQHKEFIHDRGEENAIYKRSKILSLCSVDGIDFEYRKMVDKYGEKTALTRVLDVHEPLGDKLNKMSKKLDDMAPIIHSAISSLSPTKCQLDIMHFAEKFLIVFGDETVLNEKGARFRNCSRIEALSTVIEDPDDAATAPVISKVPTTKRNRPAFNFDDEEESPKPKAAKPVDFHMDVSLDDIKRAAGVSIELLAKPLLTDILAEEVDDGANDPDNAPPDGAMSGTEGQKDFIFQRPHLFQSTPNTEDVLSRRVIRFRLSTAHMSGSVGSTTASGTGSSLHSQSIPSEVIIPIVLNSCDLLLEEKERAKWSANVSALDILNDLTAYLWYGLHPLRPEASGNDDALPAMLAREDRLHRATTFLPFLPIAVQIENVQYFLDGCIPFPSEERPKKYPVICESNPAVIELLRRLQQWVLTPSSVTVPSAATTTAVPGTQKDLRYRLVHERWMKQDLLVHNIQVIRYVAQRLREAFLQFQQVADGVHGMAPVVELDSSMMTLSFDQRHVYSVEKLQSWRALVSEAMIILFESFALYQEHCLFLYRHPFAWVPHTDHSRQQWLPFQLFSHVRCSFGTMASCLSIPAQSTTTTTTTMGFHRSVWKLQTLSLQEDAGAFGYLRFSFSAVMERWREVILNVGVTNGDAIFMSLCRPRSSPSSAVAAGSYRISAEDWAQLVRGCRPLPRQLLSQDPWLLFCTQMGKVSPSFRQLRIPSAHLMAPTTPQLALLVCCLGIAALIDARHPPDAGGRCDIVMEEQLLREFPDAVPSISEFLCSLSSADRTQVSVRYGERSTVSTVNADSHSHLPLVAFRL